MRRGATRFCAPALQTAVALQWLCDGGDSNALVHLNLAIAHLRRASPANASFASRFYYGVSRLFLSRGGGLPGP